MKLLTSAICSLVLLAGCKIVPDLNDTTNPILTFNLYYQGIRLTSPFVAMRATSSIPARVCLYVNSPFRVSANAFDTGGIRSIRIGPSRWPFDTLIARDRPDDIFALPTPRPAGPDPYPRRRGDTSTVEVLFEQDDAYDSVTLYTVYEFAPAHSRAALRATARNFGSTGWVSELWDVHVAKASDEPGRRPGNPCEIPVP